MNGEKTKSSAIKIVLSLILIATLAALAYGVTHSKSISFTSPLTFTAPPKEISILVVGDIMLDRNVRNKIKEMGFDKFFEGVKELVGDADIAVANLEGPFTIYPSKTATLVSKELTFTFDPTLVPKLRELGFDVFGLANNHTLNFGREGLKSTREYLRQAGIWYYGEPDNKEELSVVVEKNGITVGFVGFHEFSYINFDKVLAEIDRVRPTVDVLVVSPHWGIEYQAAPTESMKTWAKQYIDHGADAVIGAHPHIVGDMDEYKGKKIFYSLGNFVFDQYFSEDTMKGLAVEIHVEKSKEGKVDLNYVLIPIRIDRKGPSVVNTQ